MKTATAILALLVATSTASAAQPERIVSVGGAVTEIVYALGAGDKVVGSDTTSYYPPQAVETAKVGYQRALSAEGVISLKPDVVLLSEESGPPPVLAQLNRAGLKLVRLKARRSLDDVRANVETVGRALERETEAAALSARLSETEVTLRKAVADSGKGRRVLFILQNGGGSPMVAGTDTAADSIIELAGGKNAIVGYRGYKPLTSESAVAAAPDIILLTTQGLDAVGGADGLRNVPGLALTPALKNGRVVALDALLLLGFGPRTVEAAMALHEKFVDR